MNKRNHLCKLSALSLAVLMALSMLAGCGSPANSTSDPGSAVSQDASAGVSAPADAGQKIGPLEPYAEPVTIRVGRSFATDFKFFGDETVDENEWTKAYKEMLNIEVENMWVVDPSQAATKMSSAIASGDYPDIFTVNPTDYAKYAASGVIADVTDLYDDYLSENGRAAVEADNGYSLDAMTINGRLYGIPIVDNPLDSLNQLWIRKDWLDKLELEVPKTIDDVLKVAEAFATKDPDGNGKNDTYAFAFDGKNICSGWGGIEPFFEMYGAYPLAMNYAANFSLVEDGGALRWGGEADGMKESLAVLQQFYNDGWIAPDFGTHDDSAAIREFGNGKAGMFFAPMWGAWSAAETLFVNEPDAEVVATMLPGRDGPGKAFYVSSLSVIAVVSTKCKNPDALFKVFNLGKELVAYQEDQETFDRFNGDTMNYTGSRLSITDPLKPIKNLDNHYKITEAMKTGDVSKLDSEQMNNYTVIQEQYIKSDGPTIENIANWAAGYGLWATFANPDGGYAAIADAIEADAFEYAGYAPAATDRMAAAGSTLTDLIATSIIKIIYGEEEAAYWDTVVQDWHTLGGDIVLEDANAWYKSK